MRRKKKRTVNRILATAISLAFTVCSVPFSAFSESEKTENPTVQNGETLESEKSSKFNIRFNVSNELEEAVWLKLNEQPANEISVEIGDEILLEAETFVYEEKRYRISNIKIGDIPLFDESLKGSESYSNKFVFSKEMAEKADADGNVDITIELMQVFYTYFYFDENYGKITYADNFIKTNENITVSQDESACFSIVPAENYRVADVIIDENVKNFTENSNTVTETLSPNQNHSINVTFAKNVYNVSFDEDVEHGYVTLFSDAVNYNEETEIKFFPDDGYCIKKLTVNGEPIPAFQIIDNTFIITNITEDKVVHVEFSEQDKSSENDFIFNYNDTIYSDEKSYVFVSGTEAIFETDKNGIRLIDEDGAVISGNETLKRVSFSEDKKISAVEIYYADSEYVEPTWHRIEFSKEISFYSGLKASLSLINHDDNICYSYAKLSIDIESEKFMPEIEKIQYWIDDESERYTLNDISQREIIISAKEHRKNDMKVNVEITDCYGNVTKASSKLFSIEIPKVEVSAYGTPLKNADEKYFTTGRRIDLRIYDETETLNKDVNAFDILRDGIPLTEEEKNSMISWSVLGEKIIASIYFEKPGHYEWNFLYTNKEGIHNEGISSESGEVIYDFYIDNSMPQVKLVSSSDNTWSDIINILTFNIFKKSDVTMTVICENESEIKEIVYFKDIHTENLKSLKEKNILTELENMYNSENSPFVQYTGEIKIKPGEKAVVYVRVMNKSGKYRYISSDGIIIDGKKTDVVEFSTNEDLSKPIQNNSVEFTVTVSDVFAEKEAFSGINRIYYIVYDSNDKLIGYNMLYKWDNTIEKELCDKWTGSFTIDPFDNSKYNGDNLSVGITAIDNSGNVYTTDLKKISINIDHLNSEVSFIDSYNKDRPDENYFTSRKAIVKISNDSSSSFNKTAVEKAIKKAITASNMTDFSGNKLRSFPKDFITINWEESEEENTHIASVEFKYCGNYIWKNTVYKNLAGNTVNILDTDEIRFTIDNVTPTGSISINENVWNKLLEVLTFSLYSNDKYEVSANAEDLTSPVKIEYHINNTAELLTESELMNVEWHKYDGSFEISNSEVYNIYLRITDYAGNYIYLCSDGHIIDKSAPYITITPDEGITIENEKCFYKVNIEVTDREPYSGIKSVEYWVESNGIRTQGETLFNFEKEKPSYEDLQYKFSKTVNVDAIINNSNDTILYVKSVDNAGNETVQKTDMNIDITKPEISVIFNNNSPVNGKYFNSENVRTTATVKIKERSANFDRETATKGIKITAKNALGGNIANAFSISNWETEKGSTPDEDIHTATVTFIEDANYTFDVSYTDKAGNENSPIDWNDSVAYNEFTLDRGKPSGIVTAYDEAHSETWSEFSEDVRFSFWTNRKTNISARGIDEISGVEEEDGDIEYYKMSSLNGDNLRNGLTLEQLQKIDKWEKFQSFDIINDEQFIVYLKITDKAQNVSYLNTKEIIVDSSIPNHEYNAPEINITPEQTESGIYNSNVPVKVRVEEPIINGSFSGINRISYKVFNMNAETQRGELFNFDFYSFLEKGELIREWNGEILIDSVLNNSNDVVVEFEAWDNSGNVTKSINPMKIDITPPSITVSYDNNSSKGNLFKKSRTATITIKERNFSEKYVNLLINGQKYYPEGGWISSGGTGNGDDRTWTAKVPFTQDGDYTFVVSCTDLASNKSTETNYGKEDENSKSFVIDTSKPVITTEFVERNSAGLNEYYQSDRTMRITIEDAHFDEKTATSSVQCIMTVDSHDNNGKTETTYIKPEKWLRIAGTDKYITDISMDKNAKYTVNVQYTDMAGNTSEKYSTEFYVDKTNPKISLDVNNSDDYKAYSGDITASVSYEDTNLDKNKVNFSMSGATVEVSDAKIKGDKIIFELKSPSGNIIEWQGEFTDIIGTDEKIYGRKIDFENFPTGENMKEFDDIYTLKLSSSDKSGRSTSKNVRFSVNRYGSTYDISKIENILGTYSQTSPEIVISEINPNELKEYSVTLFKNNETISLENGKDYNVSVTGDNSKWHEYVYTISPDNFVDDGIYSISLRSVDEAENVSENTLDTKESEISFVIDNTPPKLIVANLENNITYLENEKQIIMTADDNLLLSDITVYLDNDETAFAKWSKHEISEILGKNNSEEREFKFTIKDDSTKAHTLKIICTDAAGNQTEAEFNNFYITTNSWVRLKNNKLLLLGLAIGIFAVVGGVVFIRKRKNP